MQNQAANWITLDDTGLTLHIPPIPESLTTILWLAAFAGLLLAILTAPKAWAYREKPAKLWRTVTGSLQGHYVTALILFGIVLTAWALYNYIWQIPVLIGEMLDRMKATLGRSDPPAESDDIRNIAYAFAALAGMLAILATIPFQLVRVWINERSARNAEENLTTGLINTAVEGLGAERTVSRIGRTLRIESEGAQNTRTLIEWEGDEKYSPEPSEKVVHEGEWRSFDTTEPNLEVRIGAIYSLQRIAHSNPLEHVQIMKSIAAYVRGNSARSAEPGEDIQACLDVINSRTAQQTDQERTAGYFLDLSGANLSGLTLEGANLEYADLSGSNLTGTDLTAARISTTRLEGTDLTLATFATSELSAVTLLGAQKRNPSDPDQMIPNIEARLGAVLALERIVGDNPPDHIRVMDILCAYIRENAEAEDAPDHDLGDWPDYPDNATQEVRAERRDKLKGRNGDLRSWINNLPKPRTDIQTALEVIGRRSPDRIAREEERETRGGNKDYRLDLRNTNLRRYDISHLNLAKALLTGARLEGADLSDARLEGADLSAARLEGAYLGGARLEGAYLGGARLEGADLGAARLEGAYLGGARLEGADLGAARLEGADLGAARLEGADLSAARLEGADLGGADLRSAKWAATHTALAAHFADLRGAQDLTQAQLDQMIGNTETLLPETLPDGSIPSIPSHWSEPPEFWDQMVEFWQRRGVDEARLRAEFLSPPGEQPKPTGTPLALDAPYPKGHPLADHDRTANSTPNPPLTL